MSETHRRCPVCLSETGSIRYQQGQMKTPCENAWHDIPRTRYLLGPYDDEFPAALMGLESAIDHLRAFFADQECGDEAHFRIIELTDAEVEAVPEL